MLRTKIPLLICRDTVQAVSSINFQTFLSPKAEVIPELPETLKEQVLGVVYSVEETKLKRDKRNLYKQKVSC